VAPRGRRSPLHVVLLAGGSGTRFWPLSRADRPKQLLPLAGPRPLLVETWRRARRLAPAERIWIVAPAPLVREVRRSLPGLVASRLIVEPKARDTGPAVTLACARVAAEHPEAVVGIFPSDHVIRDGRAFVAAVRAAHRAAASGALVCLGVRPDRPATGFGYLRTATAPARGDTAPVLRFVEKPSLPQARRYLASGRYLWNAGMFVWGVARYLEEASRIAPRLVEAVRGHLAGRPRAWERAPRLSVDYAIMEHARGVRVAALDAGWDDVGSWDAAARLREARGRLQTRHLRLDSPGSVVFGEDRLVALLGVPGVVVIDTPDALLVVARDRAEGVRGVVEELRRRGRADLL
jgi:mannose-1-phosphate guanylyltransferase